MVSKPIWSSPASSLSAMLTGQMWADFKKRHLSPPSTVGSRAKEGIFPDVPPPQKKNKNPFLCQKNEQSIFPIAVVLLRRIVADTIWTQSNLILHKSPPPPMFQPCSRQHRHANQPALINWIPCSKRSPNTVGYEVSRCLLLTIWNDNLSHDGKERGKIRLLRRQRCSVLIWERQWIWAPG